MILDALLQFSAAQNLAQVAGTYPSTNIIDLGGPQLPASATSPETIPIRDIGIGDDPALKLLVLVTTTFTSGGGATLQVAIQGASDNGSGLPGSFTSWWTSPAYALATLVAGARLYDMDMPRPPAGIAIPRFLQLSYVIGSATTTAGNVSAYIVIDRHDQPYNATNNAILGGYPAGITIAN
jgi:hypothetical protein